MATPHISNQGQPMATPQISNPGQPIRFIIKRQQRQAQYFNENLGNGVTLEMVVIPGGTFQMGSSETEEGHRDNESPQHRVTVQPFFMGKYPVTQAQWQSVANLPQANQKLDPDPSRFKGANRPIEQVSWFDCVEFCQRLSQYTGRNYRLPSETEWEYACRAGTTTPFHFGETITTGYANYRGTDRHIGETVYRGSYGRGFKGEYRQQTTPVGKFGVANAFGLYDMHGNVWEWCADPWHDNYEDAPTDSSVWEDNNTNHYRLLRGGSWSSYPSHCRCAYRGGNKPDNSGVSSIGFRVVCSAA